MLFVLAIGAFAANAEEVRVYFSIWISFINHCFVHAAINAEIAKSFLN